MAIGWALICLLALIGNRPVAADRLTSPRAQSGNLLKNPGFEGSYRAWSGIPEVQVAANWTPWWWEDPDHNPAYFRPEYKRALASVFPKRVLSGDSAQQWFTFHASHVAGMYQQVFGVTPGQNYRFSIWAQVWSSSEDSPYQSVQPANPHLQIGIDPTGNWSASASTVIWSAEAPMSGVIDQWGLMILEATAQNSVVTVFMRTNPDFANKHNDMYWDNAGFEAVQPPEPTKTPTVTPAPPTDTPVATNTPAATETPTLTYTPAAAATATPSSTATTTPSPSRPIVTWTATATPTAKLTSTQQALATSSPVLSPALDLSATPDVLAGAELGSTNQTSDIAPGETATGVADSQSSEESRPSEDVAGRLDNLSVAVLIVVGAAIVLLFVLILVLAKGLRRE